MLNKFLKASFIVFGILAFFSTKAFCQDNSVAIANADSTNFSVNKAGEWQLYNSYAMQYGNDSVVLELTVQHKNNIDWKLDQYIGQIKTDLFKPAVRQSIPFNLITSYYTLRVDQNGKCYLRFSLGTLPDADPAIIPIRVMFKK